MTQFVKHEAPREFGLDFIGGVPWGTHLCQFYETKEDLIDILVPYFAEGLRNNEFCMWVTSPPLEVEEARIELRKTVPELDEYVRKGQIEIFPFTEWYLLGGKFDANRVLQGWVEKEKAALSRGFDGLRLTGNTFWIERSLWKSFTDYEAAVNEAIVSRRMLAVCTYSLPKCSGNDVIDVIRNHVGTLVKRSSEWVLVEDSWQRKQAETAILRAKTEWERTFDSIPDLIAILDSQHQIVRANQAMAQRLGVRPEQCIGLNCYEFVHGTNFPPEFCPHSQTLQDGQEHVADMHEDRLGGDFLVSTTPLRDEQGQMIGSVHMARDITERKQIERELVGTLEASHRRQAEVSALLEASKAVLVHREFSKAARSIFDSCKELLGASAGYVALLSKDEKENEVLFLDAGGLPCSVDPSLPMPIRGLRAEAYSTRKVVYSNDFPSSEWAKLMPEGHVVLKNVLFSPLTVDNKTVGIIGLANKPDVFTERDAQMALAFGEIASIALINSRMLEKLEENEKLLKAHSEDLEKLVEEKTRQLKDAERLAAIGETAGMIGHDIRNPLQAIIGELYLSKDYLHSLPDGEAKQELADSMRVIEEQAIYINKIVTDLQDYAKPLAPSIENVDLEEIAESVLSTMEIPENIEVAYSIEKGFPNLMTDCSYMKRILTNLTANAVQAMPNGGKLTISAYCRDNRAFVSVEDTGEGIPEETKSKMFKPLFTTKAKGQGFGLAVVKKLTEVLNGAITFESEEGKGTNFIIEFPKNSNAHRIGSG